MLLIKDKDGDVSYFTGVQDDVTRRKKAGEKLHHQKEVMQQRVTETTQSLKENEE